MSGFIPILVYVLPDEFGTQVPLVTDSLVFIVTLDNKNLVTL